MHGQNLDQFPAVARWFFAMSGRPAVQRGKALGLDSQPEEIRARTEGAFYGAIGPAPGAE